MTAGTGPHVGDEHSIEASLALGRGDRPGEKIYSRSLCETFRGGIAPGVYGPATDPAELGTPTGLHRPAASPCDGCFAGNWSSHGTDPGRGGRVQRDGDASGAGGVRCSRAVFPRRSANVHDPISLSVASSPVGQSADATVVDLRKPFTNRRRHANERGTLGNGSARSGTRGGGRIEREKAVRGSVLVSSVYDERDAADERLG